MTSATDASRVEDQDVEHEDKPTSPLELTKHSWLYVLKKAGREFGRDQCTDLAAALTYYAVLALFPAIIALISLVGLFGNPQTTVKTLLGVLDDIGASGITKTLKPTLNSLVNNSGAAGIAFIVGLLSALWSASGYVGSFGRAMNRMYEIQEGRPFWKLRPVMLLVTLFAVVMVAVVALALVVTGPVAKSIGNVVGLGSTAVLVWDIAKWPVMLVIVVGIVAVLYYATPNVKQPKFRWISVGAALAIVIWIVASAAFGFYVSSFSSYNKTYGAMAGVIVFLLWLWITNLALLFGAEVDSELERGRELQAGLVAEETLQLPPRDTRNIEKAEEKEQQDIEAGRALRETAGGSADPDDASGSTSSSGSTGSSGSPGADEAPGSTPSPSEQHHKERHHAG